jgi:hypothetical protein
MMSVEHRKRFTYLEVLGGKVSRHLLQQAPRTSLKLRVVHFYQCLWQLVSGALLLEAHQPARCLDVLRRPRDRGNLQES